MTNQYRTGGHKPYLVYENRDSSNRLENDEGDEGRGQVNARIWSAVVGLKKLARYSTFPLLPELLQGVPATRKENMAHKNDKREVQWITESINAFNQCKNQLANVTLLAYPSQDADLALMTDARDFSLGAFLNEITSDGFKPLGFFSKHLAPAQTKYSAFDRELLAAYSAIKYF
ncbi:retrovirus-related Pol polyprotein from transposon 17.6 [Trichonephila clavipes]|uniref:Retrovirus-related Pol polyprotein from transposon 17.6 n=1 Tax=Trichonephila clavipes TaxID=2585209 RepID=A0A8X6R5N4_TRICX|nr:retrovirus-related Pol polyprotein from transposon 17.6 [Trichonephila clavipes]